MRKWLSLIALCCAMSIGFGIYSPGARAAALTSSILALKGDQSNLVEKTRYRCWWQDGYRRCGYTRGWRHRHYWRHRYWRHRYWRQRHWRQQYWREHYSREGYYDDSGYHPYRRHYYYNSYARPYSAYRRAYGYCIGLCWW
ncbi:hypothetical protein [Hyphomicrobium sp.]|jgi:hypothetical protein|uniref:hypothetical protein n=1 Tax=Hyphomicrobium sp. TaxID=82 RepID=UPI000FBAC0D3|nr:hypothetical protein [Hyphomicrobium sp.]RUO97938.1 MAG: hypothetical protein EKK30_14495 [Hyphomicrobium sp.]